MMANISENEQWKSFLDLYRSFPEIWKIKSDEYKDKQKRNKAWQMLLNNLKGIDPKATIDDVKKRINNMRTCYRRELKKKEKSEKSGAGSDDVYEPTLWYFDDLNEFLKDQETQMPGVSNLDDSDVDDDEGPKRKKRTTNEQSKEEYLQKAVEHLDYIKESKINKDEAATYAESWAVSYRKLSEVQKLYAKKAIGEILILGQLKQLTVDTVSSSSSRSSTPASTPFPTPFPPQPAYTYERVHEDGSTDYSIAQLFENPLYR